MTMDDESTLLIPREEVKPESEPPEDRYNIVYCIFFLLGVGTLLPWNFFSTAKQYFMYKLRNTTQIPAGNITHFGFEDIESETSLQVMFEGYLTLAAMGTSVIFTFANTLVTKYIKLRTRVLFAITTMVVMFIVAIALTQINTDAWQVKFFASTIVSIVIMNAGSAILQGAVFGLASMFPKRYTQGLMAGMGFGGTIAALVSIIAISTVSDPLTSGCLYFSFAVAILCITLLAYLAMPYNKFVRYYTEEVKNRALTLSVNCDEFTTSTENSGYGTSSSNDAASSEVPSTISDPPAPLSICQTLWRLKMYAFSVFITFVITISCFPALSSAIASFAPKDSAWASTYFMPVSCFFIFNCGDWLGRVLPARFQWPRENSIWLPILCLLRIGFIPLFMMCNVQPRGDLPVILNHDAYPIVLMVVFAMSNGYLSTLGMMYGPSAIAAQDQETAGSLMAFMLSSGLFGGALAGMLFTKFYLHIIQWFY